MTRKFRPEAMYKGGLWRVVLENLETGRRIVVKKDLHPLDARRIAEEWEEKFIEYSGDDSTLIEFLTFENN